MIQLGLTLDQRRVLDKLLVSHHRIEVAVALLDNEHNYLANLTRLLLGGQVDVDATASEATRSCTLELLDPLKNLQLDGDTPSDGSIYYTRMIRIIYSVIAPDNSVRFDIPLFCGPLSKVTRTGPTLSITAVGKEKFGQSSVWKARTFKAKARRTWVVREILIDIMGESPKKVQITRSNSKLPKKLNLTRSRTGWSAARSVVRGMRNKQLFYDGRGVAVLRRQSLKTAYTFQERASLLSSPSVSFDVESVVNCVEVLGGKPKKRKKKIRFRVVAPRRHSLSPWNMGRYGKPRFLPLVIEDDSIRSKKEARRIAKRQLKLALVEQVEVSFDSLPIPYLEEGDLCRISTSDWSGSFRIKKFSIPLTAEGTMSVGYLRRVVPNRRQLKFKGRNRKKVR